MMIPNAVLVLKYVSGNTAETSGGRVLTIMNLNSSLCKTYNNVGVSK